MPRLRQIDMALMATIAATLLAAIVISLWDEVFFYEVFAAEDGLFEYGTAVFLFIASLVLFAHMASLWAKGDRRKAVFTVLYGLLFFFAAGEEISWGQRIIGWESSEYFLENNHQAETNVHNMVVGGKNLAKTLFGPVLTLVLLTYLLVLPMLYGRVGWISRLADAMAVPVPQKRHALAALASTLVIAVIVAQRKWEIYEFTFSLMALGIFLLPQNRDQVI